MTLRKGPPIDSSTTGSATPRTSSRSANGRELVLDPARLPGGYLRKADRLGLDIGFTVETHLHADFVSGARELGAIDTTSIPAAPVAVMCGHGERATTAGSVLAARGRRDVTVLRGGPDHWARAHGPLATGR